MVDTGTVDAGKLDAGMVDPGKLDVGTVDMEVIDAGSVDIEVTDAGMVVAEVLDTGVVNAGTVAAEMVDVGMLDARSVDIIVASGTLDTGTGSGDAGWSEDEIAETGTLATLNFGTVHPGQEEARPVRAEHDDFAAAGSVSTIV